ncbi:MAG: hypothetical protein KJS90_08235 [Acidobacteria bacterium]|nr:hypothetical protein [Acidobacteriota bacterium]
MRTRRFAAVFTALLLASLPAPALATAPPDEDVPDEQGDVVDVPVESVPLNPSAATTIPAGCPAPTVPQMVFLGEAVEVGESTVTFRVEQIRDGTPAGYLLGDRVEVRYGRDAQLVERGRRYLVGTASDPYSPLLSSKVRRDEPLFGGDAVIGITGSAEACPDFDDPIRTVFEDGAAIDSGVLRPIRDGAGLFALAPLLSIVLVLGCLVALAMVRAIVAASRAARGRTGVRR